MRVGERSLGRVRFLALDGSLELCFPCMALPQPRFILDFPGTDDLLTGGLFKGTPLHLKIAFLAVLWVKREH